MKFILGGTELKILYGTSFQLRHHISKNCLFKVVYTMGHEVVPYRMAYSHGHTSMVQFLKFSFL